MIASWGSIWAHAFSLLVLDMVKHNIKMTGNSKAKHLTSWQSGRRDEGGKWETQRKGLGREREWIGWEGGRKGEYRGREREGGKGREKQREISRVELNNFHPPIRSYLLVFITSQTILSNYELTILSNYELLMRSEPNDLNVFLKLYQLATKPLIQQPLGDTLFGNVNPLLPCIALQGMEVSWASVFLQIILPLLWDNGLISCKDLSFLLV